MKALTLWQPWASLVAFEEKKVETRIWETKYRGLLAIHAAAKGPQWGLGESQWERDFRLFLADVESRNNWTKGHYWPNGSKAVGAVLCIVELVSIQETTEIADELSAQEYTFGNYQEGRYAWHLKLVERFKEPIPAKGNRLLWNWDAPESVKQRGLA